MTDPAFRVIRVGTVKMLMCVHQFFSSIFFPSISYLPHSFEFQIHSSNSTFESIEDLEEVLSMEWECQKKYQVSFSLWIFFALVSFGAIFEMVYSIHDFSWPIQLK